MKCKINTQLLSGFCVNTKLRVKNKNKMQLDKGDRCSICCLCYYYIWLLD